MPTNMLECLQLTDKLINVRDTLRTLYGAKWPELIQPYRTVLRKLAAERQQPILSIASVGAEAAAVQGYDLPALCYIAAAVEEIESQNKEGRTCSCSHGESVKR